MIFSFLFSFTNGSFMALFLSNNRNKTVRLRLMWDHMTVTGRLYVGHTNMSAFTLPAKYKV